MMENGFGLLHFCNDPKNKDFEVCSIERPKDAIPRKFTVPYETVYFFDTTQVKNSIYFSGGGLPLTESSTEQFFQIAMRYTIKPDMDTSTTKLANMKVARANHTMVTLTPNLLYVV